MKLTVPAIRAAEPNAHRQEVSEQTGVLLDAIDTLLAELASANTYEAKAHPKTGIRGSRQLANCTLMARTAGAAGQGASPVPPAAA